MNVNLFIYKFKEHTLVRGNRNTMVTKKELASAFIKLVSQDKKLVKRAITIKD